MIQLIVTPDFWVSRIYPEGMLERWLVKNGEKVTLDQPVAELRIEGEKITVKSPAAGKLVIEAHNNGIIEPGSVIGHIAASPA